MKPTPITFVPGAVDQVRGSRHLPLGGLVTAENFTMTKEGELAKRTALQQTSPTGLTGTVTDGAQAGNATIVRADTGRISALISSPTSRYQTISGDDLARAMPVVRGGGIVEAQARRPWAVSAATVQWIFSLTFSVAAGSLRVVGRAFDTATGSFVSSLVLVTSNNLRSLAAVYDPVGAAVWVLTLESGQINAHKIPDSTLTVSATTTYASASGGREMTSLDALYMPSLNGGSPEIVVVWNEFLSTSSAHGMSFLDTATGLPKSNPSSTVTATAIAATNINCTAGIGLSNWTGSNGNFYFSYWRASPSTNPALEWVRVRAAASGGALVVGSTDILETVTSGITNDAEIRGVSTGYRQDASNEFYFGQYTLNNTSSERPENYRIRRYDFAGLSLVNDWALGSWLASRPAQMGSNWYIVSGFEDGVGGAQRCLHLRKANSGGVDIVSQALTHGKGPPQWQDNVPVLQGSTSAQLSQGSQFTTNLEVSGNKLLCAVTTATDSPDTFRPVFLDWDFGATFGKPVALGESVVFPGGIPLVAHAAGRVHELTPLLAPPYLTGAAGGGGAVGDIVVGIAYRFVWADGRITRSAPITTTIPAATTAATLTVPNLRHYTDGSNPRPQIEIYCSRPGSTTPTLQRVIDNSIASDTQASVSPFYDSATAATTGIVVGVPLPTTGGGLLSSAAPACRSVAVWRDRLVVSGTEVDGEIWVTQEFEEGLGPSLNAAALRYFWNDGQGGITGICPAGWDNLCLFKRDAVGLLSGPGPDGIGQLGAYVPQTLQTKRGLTNPASLYVGPDGAGFQDSQTGRMCMVTPAGQILENGQGIDDFRTSTILCAAYLESLGQVWLGITGGVWLVQDVRFPIESEKGSARQWWKWTSGALTTPAVVLDTPTGPLIITAAGKKVVRSTSTYRDEVSGTPTDYFEKVKTSKLTPFGRNGSGMLDQLIVQAHYQAGHTLKITVTPDGGTPSVHTVVATTPGVWVVEPSGCLHVTEVEVTIEETASATAGFVLEAITMLVKPDPHSRLATRVA